MENNASRTVKYKTVDLFGNETEVVSAAKKSDNKTLFDDYDGFVEKFKQKKTTDDCYTPPEVYKVVLDFVAENYDLTGLEIIRPFYPGGDYENIDYPENCIVIDNPPFSIISQICRFYIEQNIRYFLFAPHLTLFGADIDHTAIVCGGDIVYENGAAVKTSFLSNLFGDIRVIATPELYSKFVEIKEKNKVRLPIYKYPNHVLTVSMVQYMVNHGISFSVKKNDCQFCRGLNDQKQFGKAIFGSGFLLSDKAAAEKAAAEKAAAEKDNVIYWKLSKIEKKVIANLGK